MVKKANEADKAPKALGVYTATVGLTNDATGAMFGAGALVVDGDFPADVITHWLNCGVLVNKEAANDGSDTER